MEAYVLSVLSELTRLRANRPLGRVSGLWAWQESGRSAPTCFQQQEPICGPCESPDLEAVISCIFSQLSSSSGWVFPILRQCLCAVSQAAQVWLLVVFLSAIWMVRSESHSTPHGPPWQPGSRCSDNAMGSPPVSGSTRPCATVVQASPLPV